MARVYSDTPLDRIRKVKDGDVLDLGGKTLRFIEAPWLHWPETMFTFAVEDRVLLPCDFFGAHIASASIFDDEVGDILIPEAKKYYAEIMMPYQKMAARGLEKAQALEPRVIGPSHGPVYRNPRRILGAYEQWIKGPLDKKAVVLYVSMWGSTQRLADIIVEAISAEGVQAVPYDLTVADTSFIAGDLVDAAAVVIGTPTLVGGAHPLINHALALARMIRPRLRLAGIFGSYGWGGGAASQVKSQLDALGIETVDMFEVKGPPKEGDVEKARALGQAIARRAKETLG